MYDLVEVDDERRHADLAGEQDMLAVCGIGPSARSQPGSRPSICAAPVIMFFT